MLAGLPKSHDRPDAVSRVNHITYLAIMTGFVLWLVDFILQMQRYPPSMHSSKLKITSLLSIIDPFCSETVNNAANPVSNSVIVSYPPDTKCKRNQGVSRVKPRNKLLQQFG